MSLISSAAPAPLASLEVSERVVGLRCVAIVVCGKVDGVAEATARRMAIV